MTRWWQYCDRAMYEFTDEERRRRIGIRHHLTKPARSPLQVTAALVGLHSTDPATVYLSCRARLSDFRRSQLEKSLYEERSVLRMLGMRRTMFVVPQELGPVIDAGCARPLAAGERRRLVSYLEEQEVTNDGERWLQRVEALTIAALQKLGPATAKELSAEVPELTTKLTFGVGKKWGGQLGVSTRVLSLLATGGQIVRGKPLGSWLSSQYRWAALEDWVPGGFGEAEKASAQAELVRRWLASYGPGSLTDISWWTGWGKRVTAMAIEACGGVAVDMAGTDGFALADDLEQSEEGRSWAAFLPSLDSTIMGWKEREWYLGEHQAALYDRNGNAGPTVWLDGRVIGGWSQHPTGAITYRILEDVGSEAEALITAEASSLEAWLGDDRLTPRFRTPLEKELTNSEPR